MEPEDDSTGATGGETTDSKPIDADGDVPSMDASDSGPAEGGRRLSRRSAWLAMGAVALALGLVWIAPGAEDSRVQGDEAPLHFTLTDMNGVDVKLSSFKGKVILVNFWATWCGPCELEIPDLVAVQKQYPDDLVILGVSIDDTAEMLKPYAAKKQMNYPVLVGLNREDVQDAFGPLFGIPVSVFVDRAGKIALRHSGIASKEQIEREIKALL
jgi:thiol-disulfide isomerase/thioredoxin